MLHYITFKQLNPSPRQCNIQKIQTESVHFKASPCRCKHSSGYRIDALKVSSLLPPAPYVTVAKELILWSTRLLKYTHIALIQHTYIHLALLDTERWLLCSGCSIFCWSHINLLQRPSDTYSAMSGGRRTKKRAHFASYLSSQRSAGPDRELNIRWSQRVPWKKNPKKRLSQGCCIHKHKVNRQWHGNVVFAKKKRQESFKAPRLYPEV